MDTNIVYVMAMIGCFVVVYGFAWLGEHIFIEIVRYIESRRARSNERKFLNIVMNPKCSKCHDQGIIHRPTFDTDDPSTYDDYFYCNCSIGVRYHKDYLGDDQ